MSVLLSELMMDDQASAGRGLAAGTGAGLPDPAVRGVTADSREVRPGYLFAAIPGVQRDGRRYIPQAIARGATAVLAPPGTSLPRGAGPVRLVVDPNPRRRLAGIAARFYPDQPAMVAAVTGTNGKSSVAEFTRQLWAAAGHAGASLGTLGLVVGTERTDPGLTTPDPVRLHETLQNLAGRGIDRLALEASSHGLDQFRLDGVRIRAAAFTNLSRDHLDYHGSMAAYRSAKLRLFTDLLDDSGHAVVNADEPAAEIFAAACQTRGIPVTRYGRRQDSDLVLDGYEPGSGGGTLALTIDGTVHRIRLRLPGAFQAMNVLAALGLLRGLEDAPVADLLEALPGLTGVPGRLEPVGSLEGRARVYVDYAHTPDALGMVLAALRPHVEGRLVCVFGAGGDRDAGKREHMGRAVSRGADLAIVTDDNPRSEEPAAIRRAVLRGCPGGREIGDRADAIAAGLDLLAPGDALLIAGKGHETGQHVGDRVLPFDDRCVARRMLAERGGAPA